MGVFGTSKMKLFAGSDKVKKAYLGTEKIYSAGNIVTYYVDRDEWYTEEVDSDASCLNPTTFTPTKSGWEFVGWRSDTTASDSVWTSKVMGDEPITLYAVFKQTVTLTYYNNSTSKSATSGTKYYNNGNTVNPKFTLSQASKSGWSARGWSTGTAGNASISYSSISNREFSSSTTLYGLYYKTCTLTAKSYNSTKTATGAAYYNSAGNTTNATCTVPTAASYSGWTFRGWSHDGVTTANATAAYANGATFTLGTGDATVYGLYSQTIYLYYNGNGSTSGSVSTQSGTRYYNAYGNTSNPSFVLASNGYSRTNASFLDWACGSVGGTRYAAGATVTLSSSTTFYAKWRVSVPISTTVSNYNFHLPYGCGYKTCTPITLYPQNGGSISGTVVYTATGGQWTGGGWPAGDRLDIYSNPSGISTSASGSWQGAPPNVSASMDVSGVSSVSIVWSSENIYYEDDEHQLDYGFRYSTQTLTATEVYVA